MVDTKGYYQAHVNPKNVWGGPGGFNTGENISRDAPRLASRIVNSPTAATNNMSKGDLTRKIEVDSTDETHALAVAIERLRISMRILMDKYG